MMEAPSPPGSGKQHSEAGLAPRRPIQVAVAGCVAGVLLLLIAALSAEHTRGTFDQNEFHLKVIQRFASTWPGAAWANYESMTTPGYHWAMAGLMRVAGAGLEALRGVNGLIAVGLIGLLAFATSGSKHPIALCLPLSCSIYFVSSGVWLLPDNAAWLVVLWSIYLAMTPVRSNGLQAMFVALAFVLVVLLRQNQIWVAGPLVIGALISGEGSFHRPKIRPATWTALALLPGVICLGYFVWLWGGLAPPMFRDLASKPNPAIPAVILAIAGAYGVFFLPYLWPELRTVPKRNILLVSTIAAIVGIVVAGVPHTSISRDEGRYTGMWNVVRFAPVVFDRSMAMIAMACLGSVLLGLFGLALRPRDRWILLACVVGFMAVQSRGALAWQRYYEPFVLMLFPLICSRLLVDAPRWAWIGPALIAAGLLTVTALGLGVIPS